MPCVRWGGTHRFAWVGERCAQVVEREGRQLQHLLTERPRKVPHSERVSAAVGTPAQQVRANRHLDERIGWRLGGLGRVGERDRCVCRFEGCLKSRRRLPPIVVPAGYLRAARFRLATPAAIVCAFLAVSRALQVLASRLERQER
eukprot:855291-Prymnesium_polylepis.1